MDSQMSSDERRRIVCEAAQLLVDAERGEPGAQSALAAWAERQPRHVGELLEQARLKNRLRALTDDDWQEALQRVRRRSHVIALQPDLRARSSLNQSGRRTGWMRVFSFVTAGILVCGFFGGLWWHTTQANLYATGAGEWRRIQLVDHSTIKLNGQSAVRVHYTRHARDIELLRGEAFFSVAHDSRRPFRVRSGQSVIQAIGTEFIVRESKSDLDVLVTAGRITFSVPTEGVERAAPIVVKAGQGASLATNRRSTDVRVRTLSAAEKRNALLSGGLLELKGEPLREIATRLHEAGSARIVIGDERAGSLRLGGVLRVEQAEDFVQVLRYFPQLMVSGPDGSGAYHVSSAEAPEPGPAQRPAPIGGRR